MLKSKRRNSFFYGGLLAAALVCVGAAPAPAAVQIGQTMNRGWTCSGDGYTMLQKTTQAAPAYAVPAGGGVITSWSHQANDAPNARMSLEVFRPTGVANEFRAVGQSAVEQIEPNGLRTFATRIPVQEGDLIGLAIVSGDQTACNFPQTFSNGDATGRVNVDTAPGTTYGFLCCDYRYRVNVGATVEPDADGDGLGDETQEVLAPAISSAPLRFTPQTDATFVFSSPRDDVTFRCRLLSEPRFQPCSSPKAYAGLAEGTHAFRVFAVDAAGNRSDVSGRTWEVDHTPPELSITGGPSGTVGRASADFTFSSDEARLRFRCWLDGVRLTPCASPLSVSGLADGRHRLAVSASDAAGNVSAVVRRSWVVDSP